MTTAADASAAEAAGGDRASPERDGRAVVRSGLVPKDLTAALCYIYWKTIRMASDRDPFAGLDATQRTERKPNPMAITSSTALYNKYRPQRFDEVVGQVVPVQTMRNAIETGKVSNAYLLSGLHGTGKTSLARIFAKALLCKDDDRDGADACCQCPACRAFDAGSLPDYIEEDAASNRGIDNIRTIINQISLSPQVSDRKVVLIDEVHHLTSDAATGLLKKLEEPPAGVVFLLVTTDPMKLPSTIRSRCQWLRFKPLTDAEISLRLARIAKSEGIVTEPNVCDEIAKSGAGSMRDAVSNLSQVAGFVGNRPVTLDDVSQCLGITSVERVRTLGDVLAKDDLAGALALEFPEEEGGAKGALSGLLSLLYEAMLPNDPEEHRDMTVEALRLRQRQWIVHARDVIERNFWKLDNASFPNEHVLGEIYTMIVMPETDPHCSNALAGISQQATPQATGSDDEIDDKKVDRILKGVMTVYREIHGMTDAVSGLSERLATIDKVGSGNAGDSISNANLATFDDIQELRQVMSEVLSRSETQGQAMKVIIDLLRAGAGTGKRKASGTGTRRKKAASGEGSSGGDEDGGLSYRQPEF